MATWRVLHVPVEVPGNLIIHTERGHHLCYQGDRVCLASDGLHPPQPLAVLDEPRFQSMQEVLLRCRVACATPDRMMYIDDCVLVQAHGVRTGTGFVCTSLSLRFGQLTTAGMHERTHLVLLLHEFCACQSVSELESGTPALDQYGLQRHCQLHLRQVDLHSDGGETWLVRPNVPVPFEDEMCQDVGLNAGWGIQHLVVSPGYTYRTEVIARLGRMGGPKLIVCTVEVLDIWAAIPWDGKRLCARRPKDLEPALADPTLSMLLVTARALRGCPRVVQQRLLSRTWNTVVWDAGIGRDASGPWPNCFGAWHVTHDARPLPAIHYAPEAVHAGYLWLEDVEMEDLRPEAQGAAMPVVEQLFVHVGAHEQSLCELSTKVDNVIQASTCYKAQRLTVGVFEGTRQEVREMIDRSFRSQDRRRPDRATQEDRTFLRGAPDRVGETCPVCQDNPTCVVPPCGHTHCMGCAKRVTQCPVCRADWRRALYVVNDLQAPPAKLVRVAALLRGAGPAVLVVQAARLADCIQTQLATLMGDEEVTRHPRRAVDGDAHAVCTWDEVLRGACCGMRAQVLVLLHATCPPVHEHPSLLVQSLWEHVGRPPRVLQVLASNTPEADPVRLAEHCK